MNAERTRLYISMFTILVLLVVILRHVFYTDPMRERVGFYCGELVALKAKSTPKFCYDIVPNKP